MTKQEKQLLLIDLCARLPYGVKIRIEYPFTEEKDWHPEPLFGLDLEREVIANTSIRIEEFKPYLRPMSSMTEEEREHLQTLHNIISDENYGDGFSPAAWEAILDFNNYCREHHLDNGGLITLGLCLEAPEGMYK